MTSPTDTDRPYRIALAAARVRAEELARLIAVAKNFGMPDALILGAIDNGENFDARHLCGKRSAVFEDRYCTRGHDHRGQCVYSGKIDIYWKKK